ncbi:MAG: ATP-binding protein [Candidatus Gracilibacteria bacterium]
MKIRRVYSPIEKLLKPNKVLVVYGPRQVGKTTLIKDCDFGAKKVLWDTGDNFETRVLFESENFKAILAYSGDYDVLAIDEAQMIPKIGQGLKILVDHKENLSILVTGSSSFALAGQIGEPLTGRHHTLTLFPISQYELLFGKHYSEYELQKKLSEFLIYGSYPEVVTAQTLIEKQTCIEDIARSYLFKDILAFEDIKNSKTLLDLVRLLAFQIGNEVSLSELGQQVGMDKKTVMRYLDILEKAFVIYEVRGYSRNLRKEITKKSKYYFYDTGIRNALISNFNPIDVRNDQGQLWENFVFMERLKARAYQNLSANVFFWRTWGGQEVDIVEERGGKLFGYECKWSSKKGEKQKAPSDWLGNYKEASYQTITPENYLDFVGDISREKL